MAQFSIINESTEDTFGSTDNLQEAIRIAREVTRQGQSHDPVSILDSAGQAVRQYVLLPGGKVAEQPIVHAGK